MALPKRIETMHILYGRQDAHTCGQCALLLRRRHNRRTWFKCTLQRFTHGAATDWRTSWPACGKFLQTKEPQHAA
jgi:hypothetical protein